MRVRIVQTANAVQGRLLVIELDGVKFVRTGSVTIDDATRDNAFGVRLVAEMQALLSPWLEPVKGRKAKGFPTLKASEAPAKDLPAMPLANPQAERRSVELSPVAVGAMAEMIDRLVEVQGPVLPLVGKTYAEAVAMMEAPFVHHSRNGSGTSTFDMQPTGTVGGGEG